MCHSLLLPVFYSNQPLLLLGLILFCGTVRRQCPLFHDDVEGTYLITNYTERIPTRLKQSDKIILSGVLLQSLLYVDLRSDRNATPFHLRALGDRMVFSNFKNSGWYREITFVPFPLTINASFTIEILIRMNDEFDITVDERILYHIPKRDSLEHVRELAIYGNITLKSVEVIQIIKADDSSTKYTIIIAVVITLAVVLITGLGIFLILRRHNAKPTTQDSATNEYESILESINSFETKQAGQTSVAYLGSDALV